MRKLILLVFVMLFVACPPTQKNAAKIYIQRGEYELAREQILLGLEQTPGDYEYYVLLTKVESGLADWVSASRAFKEALKLDSLKAINWLLRDEENLDAYWQTFYNAAYSLYLDKKYEEALYNLGIAKTLNPQNVSQYILEGGVYGEMDNTEMSNKAYSRALSIDPENPEAYYLIGKSLFEKQLYDSSLFYFDDAAKFFKAKIGKIEKILFQNLPVPNQELTQKMIKLWIEKKTAELDEFVKSTLGFESGLDGQRRNIELYYKTTDGMAQSYYLVGMAYYNLNKNKEALQHFTKSLDLMPDDMHALFFTGLTYVKLQNYRDAITYFEKVSQMKPNDREAWFYIGACHLQLKEYQKAIDIYENKVLQIDPKFVEAMTNLASAYQSLGKNKKAYEWLVKAEQVRKEQQ